MAERDENSGRFLNGHAGVGGRPKGSRVKLSEAFLSDLNDSWDTHGVKALNLCATTEPTIFCRIVASILPKKIDSTLEVNVFDNYDLSDAQQFAQAYKLARQMLGVAPIQQSMIEVESDRRDAEMFSDDD
jgi:hypothetical protein